MKTSLAAVGVFAAAAQANPFRNPGTTFLATFDDLPSLPGVSQLNPVGNYKGLDRKALDVLQASVLGINVAANGFTNTLVDGGISIAAQKGESEVFKTVNYQFEPTNPLISKMTKATFDWEFEGLDHVDVAVVGGLTPSTLTSLLIDNVQYKTYSK